MSRDDDLAQGAPCNESELWVLCAARELRDSGPASRASLRAHLLKAAVRVQDEPVETRSVSETLMETRLVERLLDLLKPYVTDLAGKVGYATAAVQILESRVSSLEQARYGTVLPPEGKSS